MTCECHFNYIRDFHTYCHACNLQGGTNGGTCACVNCGEAPAVLPPVLYVNAYEISRAYGGPEEGGWWYNVGELLHSVPVSTAADECLARTLLRALDLCESEDLNVCTQDHPGASFPTHRPHYE